MPVRWFVAFAAVMLAPASGLAYPGGTPNYVTDVAPYCASCHSSRSAAQLGGISENRIKAELVENKHLAKILAGKPDGPYAELTAAQRQALAAGVQRIDESASIEIVTPLELKANQVFEVTVNAAGGGGPVVGIALVDAGHRWQARPAPSAGWQIIARPEITGPDGKPQSRFLDARLSDLPPGVSYVNVYGIQADPDAGTFAKVRVVYRLRAPALPGTYPIAAVFLYGTEKGSPHGAVEQIQGKSPLGGFGGASGRVLFSDVRRVRVE